MSDLYLAYIHVRRCRRCSPAASLADARKILALDGGIYRTVLLGYLPLRLKTGPGATAICCAPGRQVLE